MIAAALLLAAPQVTVRPPTPQQWGASSISSAPQRARLGFTTGAPPARPDIVIVVGDDIAASDVSTYGGPAQTPNLTALAARGVRFTRAYAHAKCDPTRDSLYYSHWLGRDLGDGCAPPLPEGHHPLDLGIAQVMAGQGYATCHVGKWHVGSSQVGPWYTTPETLGWGSALATYPIGDTCSAAVGGGRATLNDGVATSTNGGLDTTVIMLDAFEQWWAANEGRPRFVLIETNAAHPPFKYPPASILPAGYPTPLPGTNRQRYEAEIASVDVLLGRVMEAVGDDGFVWFMGDNGTPGWNETMDPAANAARPDQDPFRVKLSCYEDGVHVPFVVAGPGVVARDSDALVHVVDVVPTLYLMANVSLAVPSQLKGRQLGAVMVGGPGPHDPVYVHNTLPRLDRAMIGPRWKLLTRTDGVEELYDLETDPAEQNPLPPTGPEADELRALRDAAEAGG